MGIVRDCEKGYRVGPLYAKNEDVARLLLSRILAWSEGKSGTVAAEVNMGNKAAVKFFEDHGWTDVGVDYSRVRALPTRYDIWTTLIVTCRCGSMVRPQRSSRQEAYSSPSAGLNSMLERVSMLIMLAVISLDNGCKGEICCEPLDACIQIGRGRPFDFPTNVICSHRGIVFIVGFTT